MDVLQTMAVQQTLGKKNSLDWLASLESFFFVRSNCLIIIAIMLTINSCYSQGVNLSGDIRILKKGKCLNANLSITNYETNALVFALNKRAKIYDVKINGVTLKVKKVTPKSINCTVYEASTIKLTSSDTLTIQYRIKPKNNLLFKNRSDYKGEVSLNDGILRASEQSKWVPVFIKDTTMYSDDYFWKTSYTYNLKISHYDGGNIYLNHGTIENNHGEFVCKQPSENLLLIAGKFDTSETKNTLFIGDISDSNKRRIDILTEDIKTYYGKLSNKQINTQFTFAHLPSDNLDWGGFFTYPTMVNVNRNINLHGLESYMSHEIAHFYFGNEFHPKGILSLLYIEAFSEYYSLKYKIYKEIIPAPKNFMTQYKKENYFALSSVKKPGDITDKYRYTVFPYLLLELEGVIGVSKMKMFIQTLFESLEIEDEYGVEAIDKTLHVIGVSLEQRSNINNQIFNKYK